MLQQVCANLWEHITSVLCVQNTKSGRALSQEVPLDPPPPRFNLTELDKAEEKEWMNGTFRFSFLLSFRGLTCESMNDLV